MRFLLSSMLLSSLCAPVSRSASVITQSADVSVVEGENVTLTCCWSKQGETFKVSWMKNQTQVKLETFEFTQDNEQETRNCSSLTFESTRREDSGRYICKLIIEIPKLMSHEGSGTIINVIAKDGQKKGTEKENTYLIEVASDSHQDELQYNLLRCLPVLALFISFCFLYKSSTKAQHKTAATPGNTPSSDRVVEENPEEEEQGQRTTEAE